MWFISVQIQPYLLIIHIFILSLSIERWKRLSKDSQVCALEKSWFSEGHHIFWYSLSLECLISHSFLFIFYFSFYFLSNLFLTRHLELAQCFQWAWKPLEALKILTDITQKTVPALHGTSHNYSAPQFLQAGWFLYFTAHHLLRQVQKDTKPPGPGDVLHIALEQACRQGGGKAASLLDWG